jgi:hypothetical protein
MKRINHIMLVMSVLLLIGLVTVLAAPRLASKALTDDSKYRVFCADNKIEVEQRTVEQEKNARGSNVCMLAEFDYASDANKYAEEHGGKGSECKCN